MKKFKDTLFFGCFATVLLIFVFFTFIAIDSGLNKVLTHDSFLLLLMVGMLIAATALIFEVRSFPFGARLGIHFFIQLADLFILLFTTGMMKGKNTKDYFLLIIGYTILYALIALLIFGVKKLYAYLLEKYRLAHQKDEKFKHTHPTGIGTSKKSPAKSKNASSQGTKGKSASKTNDNDSGYTPLYK